MRKLSAPKRVAIDANNIVPYGQSSFLDVVTNETFAPTLPISETSKTDVCSAYLTKRRIEKTYEELKIDENMFFAMLHEIDTMQNKQLIENEAYLKNMTSAKEIRNFLNWSK